MLSVGCVRTKRVQPSSSLVGYLRAPESESGREKGFGKSNDMPLSRKWDVEDERLESVSPRVRTALSDSDTSLMYARIKMYL